MFLNFKRIVKIIRIKLKRKAVYFATGANFSLLSDFEGQNKIGVGSWVDGYIGYGSYVGDRCILRAKIGKYCSIGHDVKVLTGTHPSKVFVSTHPVFFSLAKQNGTTYVHKQKFKESIYADEVKGYGCIIGNDVWIGHGATIMGGVTIGDGAIIAANALIRENVEPYTIMAGQPARVIRTRFNMDQIEWLNRFCWWDKSESWIMEHADEFDDIEKFMKVNDKK